MLGSYFMSNGAEVSQAAAGLGGEPGFTQASAGLGIEVSFAPASAGRSRPTNPLFSHGVMAERTMGDPIDVACRGRFQPGTEQYAECVDFMRYSMGGQGGAVAETPNVVGARFGEQLNVFRDGIFSEGTRSSDYGELNNVFRDGIFAGSIQSGMGAATAPGALLDMQKPAILKQVKMMLRSIDPNLPASDFELPWWTTDIENTWHMAVLGTAMKTNTPPEVAATWNTKVGGRDVPTAQGLYSVFGYAIQGVAPNYPDTYWPALSAWIKSGGTALNAPPLTEAESHRGLSTAKMFGFGAAAAGIVLAGLWLMKKKRGGSAAL